MVTGQSGSGRDGGFGGDQDGTGDEGHLQLTTLQGWRRFVTEVPGMPQLLAEPVWLDLDQDKRLAYDDDRIEHHSRLLVVQTPASREVVNSGRRLAQLNRTAHYGRCGLVVSGPARTGKTTAITQLGKTLEVIHRRRYPRSPGDIPVVYITVPPAATPKMIAMEFARFFGLPISRRSNITERIPATFVFAGISLERSGLLAGIRGEQIAGRFGIVRTGPFSRGQQWTTLIAALEDSLRLHRHRPGTLTRLETYLHQRTRGMIGSLLWLIRGAAIAAVIDGTEKITRKSLDAIETDIASQTTSPITR